MHPLVLKAKKGEKEGEGADQLIKIRSSTTTKLKHGAWRIFVMYNDTVQYWVQRTLQTDPLTSALWPSSTCSKVNVLRFQTRREPSSDELSSWPLCRRTHVTCVH